MAWSNSLRARSALIERSDVRRIPPGELKQHIQSLKNARPTYLRATDVAEIALMMHNSAIPRGCCEMNEPDRLAGCCAARSRNPGNRHCEIDAGFEVLCDCTFSIASMSSCGPPQ